MTRWVLGRRATGLRQVCGIGALRTRGPRALWIARHKRKAGQMIMLRKTHNDIAIDPGCRRRLITDVKRAARVAGVAGLLCVILTGCGTPFRATEQSILTAATPAARLVVTGNIGNVIIQADPAATEVTAKVRRIGKGSSATEAAKALAELEATLAPEPNEEGVLLASMKHPLPTTTRQYEVSWWLTCPPDVAVEVHTEIGDVTVRGVTGGLRVKASIGDVEVEVGGRVDIASNIGDIRLKLLPGAPAPVRVVSDIGDIYLTLPLDRIGRLITDTDLGSLRLRLEGMMLQVIRQRSNHFDAQFGESSEPIIDLTSDIGDIIVDSYSREGGPTATEPPVAAAAASPPQGIP